MRNLKNTFHLTLFIFILSGAVSANNSNLPDFTKLVEDNSASIVNISTVKKNVDNNKKILYQTYQMMSSMNS